uniref:hypothetical protein n=1 Tax=uncultured Draconibacterium sp. TaxID=1573823 RepID=UPI003216D314
MGKYILTKNDPMKLFFKCKDRTGRTNTSSVQNAKVFNSKDEAINYNHDELYGDYEVEPIIEV